MPAKAPPSKQQIQAKTKQQGFVQSKTQVPQIWHIKNNKLHLSFHPGQARVWQSDKRMLFMLAGTQGGKTSFGPWWLWREIMRRGSADYLCVTGTYDLFKLKLLPVMRETFESILGVGRYWSGAGVIELRDPETGEFWAERSDSKMWGRIILRSAVSRGGLESTTAAAAWIDEGGQEVFTQDTWEAILRRLSLYQGRTLTTTTLYQTRGWLRGIFDLWNAGDPDVDVIQFDSTKNPAFTKEEFERAKSTMADWRFNLFYRGQFAQLPGQIYTLPSEQIVRPFPIHPTWPRYVGVDFGAVNTALVWLAQDPWNDTYYVYRSYLDGNKTSAEHCARALGYTKRSNDKGAEEIVERVEGWYGGSASERQPRLDWMAAGVPVMRPPIDGVEAGIDRVTTLLKTKRLFVFDDQEQLIKEFRNYSREMDDQGNVYEHIRDKQTYHHLDALRYVVTARSQDIVTYGPSIWT